MELNNTYLNINKFSKILTVGSWIFKKLFFLFSIPHDGSISNGNQILVERSGLDIVAMR